MKIFVDMDGVVADFMGMLAKHGHTRTKWRDEELWPIVNAIPNFWGDMPVMKDARKLMSMIRKHDVAFLTAPTRFDARCKGGKAMFAWKHFRGIPIMFARACEKKNRAEPGALLIDDNKGNVNQWRKAGGVAVLYTTFEACRDEIDGIIKSFGTL
jgi:hypothetical protein